MTSHTRRNFIQSATAAAVYSSPLLRCDRLMASPFGLPIGLQLYSVREMMAKDYEGTLKQIGALGYQEVETAGYFDHSSEQVKSAMSAAGLKCVSAHYPYASLNKDFDKIVAFNKEIGVQYIICAFPGIKDPSRLKDQSYRTQITSFTLEDYRWNADQFNKFGEKLKAAGMKFGYHNHTMEFAKQDGVVPFDEMVRLTDPALVTFEMDCGWVIVGGANPVDYLHRYPSRISMLHVKDFKHIEKPASTLEPPPAAELGRGTLDYRPVFEAAKKANIKHYFVEQEEFDLPPMESLKIDADYMKNLTV
ncbi:sugar phosphate isomerase/epimerase family protein [Tunturiibacter gelidoferens]|jgi:sugar phosphate isomerase/epimerase|uniref:Sugar phosphate isomerase/epimerase n=1 Tax=Tunturiibacter gelidiferens TaxID=3069689 RepID=A0A9X0QA39_9BACT|nr:sugar phosphate isomerase/epimerase [Edaphobacter lichenicola]MBB5326475.1 sugar phosphate isomerase/epimerase [Edaphobacter lichenicola]